MVQKAAQNMDTMQAPQQTAKIANDPVSTKEQNFLDKTKMERGECLSAKMDNLRGVSSEWNMGQDLSSAICDNVEFSSVFDEVEIKAETPPLMNSSASDLDSLSEITDQTRQAEVWPHQEKTTAPCPLSDDQVKKIMNEDLPLDIQRKKYLRWKRRKQRFQVKSDDYLGVADIIRSTCPSNQPPIIAAPAPVLSSPTCTKQKGSSTPKVFCEPTEKDVLLGRGGLANRHPGNKRFRDEARKLNPWYSTSSKAEKYKISEVLVEYIRSYRGRFLEFDRKSNRWYEVTKTRARAKASQALREEKNHKKIHISPSK